VILVIKQIVIFDGICNFCSCSVDFIIRHDPERKFKFTSMQSEVGQNLIKKYHIRKVGFDTFVLIQGDEYLLRTDAALEVARQLSGGWSYCKFLKIIPRPIRDFIYRFFARNRFRFFGKRLNCRIPTEVEKQRFI
jgi:predicted DCC family thiol-disulfide oxidoreductase YuxK